MIKHEIPEDHFASSGLSFTIPVGSPVAVFTYPKADPEDETERALTVQVATNGTELRFFPERSTAQKILMNKLGIAG